MKDVSNGVLQTNIDLSALADIKKKRARLEPTVNYIHIYSEIENHERACNPL